MTSKLRSSDGTKEIEINVVADNPEEAEELWKKVENQKQLLFSGFYYRSSSGRILPNPDTDAILTMHRIRVINSFHKIFHDMLSEYNAFEENKYCPPVVIDATPSKASDSWEKITKENARARMLKSRYNKYHQGQQQQQHMASEAKKIKVTTKVTTHVSKTLMENKALKGWNLLNMKTCFSTDEEEELKTRITSWVETDVYDTVVDMVTSYPNGTEKPFVHVFYKIRQITETETGDIQYVCFLKL